MTQAPEQPAVEAHAGKHAVAVAAAHGVGTMFTLSGAHVFPMYDGAVNADPPMRIIDVRHEQTAAFAAEAIGKLTRTPGLAVLTAGPGVTNGVSAVAQAQFSGSPMVVVGGRAPANRWGSGSLQELDQPPIIAPVSKLARTIHTAAEVPDGIHEAFTIAGAPHRGPVFVDVPMDEFFATTSATTPTVAARIRTEPDPDAVTEIAELLGQARRPVLVLGTDVWADGAEEAALRLVEQAGIPAITNGMGRGVVPGGTRSWSPRRGVPHWVAPTSSWWPAPHSTSASATASSAGRTAPPRRASCTSRTRPSSSPGTPTWPPRRRATSPWSSTGCARRCSDWSADPTGTAGSLASRTPSGRPSRETPSSCTPRPTRSIPPGSTASWYPGWPTTAS